MNRNNLKENLIKIIINGLFAIFIVILLFSIYQIFIYKVNEESVKKELEIINDNSEIVEVNDSDNTEIISEESIFKNDPYWDYINTSLIDVNFDELKLINKNIKGWIQVNGTNINYPFVQGTDNKYYLSHSFDNTYNKSGWLFLDYRNDIADFNNKNTIIYGHSMYNKTMLGTLENTLTDSWLNNSDNHIIMLSTEYENTLWQVFSVYHISTTTDYLKEKFDTDDEFNKFTKMLADRSIYNFKTSVSSNDRILTLSSCYKSTERIVLHAKLIKREVK